MTVLEFQLRQIFTNAPLRRNLLVSRRFVNRKLMVNACFYNRFMAILYQIDTI